MDVAKQHPCCRLYSPNMYLMVGRKDGATVFEGTAPRRGQRGALRDFLNEY